MDRKTVEITIRGIVQGVGFRPNVFRLARRHHIVGGIRNVGEGVVIRAQGTADRLKAFQEALSREAPPLAKITKIISKPVNIRLKCTDFSIEKTRAGSSKIALVPPDVALCDDCRRELLDPTDHRHLYPFINCTNCGPRYSIIYSIPYDRPNTSMRSFSMCPACEQEYRDPMDRRFHAQPNACWQCGPRLAWHDATGHELDVKDPVAHAVRALSQGRLVAIKGLGGFHLAADAASDHAVALLRQRKKRPHKPLAIMVKDLASADRIAWIDEVEKELLLSRERPIVLLKKKKGRFISDLLAPGIDRIGVMMPYSPVHYLLFQCKECPEALVMTSGNTSGRPICKDNQEALDHLRGIADFFLLYDREIVTRIDDSVAIVIGGKARIIRRARGLVPDPVSMPWQDHPNLLAVGPELKNTFCLARRGEAFLSQHIGDMQALEDLDFFQETVEHLKGLLDIRPEVVACDLHPDYMTTRYARNLSVPLTMVQHHLAHAAAVVAEHGLKDPAVALVLDGTGYGTDGTIWGGEILLVNPGDWKLRRMARLRPMPLPGGDAATREPWRMALSALWTAYGPSGLEPDNLPPALLEISDEKRDAIKQMIKTGLNTPLTSSCGRLFDAVAALLGVRSKITYEAQAAMEIVTLAQKALSDDNGFGDANHEKGAAAVAHSNLVELDWVPIIRGVLSMLNHGMPPSLAAAWFHQKLIELLSEGIERCCRKTGIRNVVLGGGCMQNPILLQGLARRLECSGAKVFSPEVVPANDGGISLGQAVIAGGLARCA